MIELRHVTKEFGAGRTLVRALADVSFVIPRGGFWSIVGPSGSGKSTVLHLVAGLTAPTTGTVLLDGVDVATLDDHAAAVLRRRKIGYLLQTFDLMPFLSAVDNVGVPLMLDGQPRRTIQERAMAMLALVQMEHRAAHRPHELSGGELQRVALARALVIEPAILLADEPTGNLDSTAGEEILRTIRRCNRERGVTVVLVTHSAVAAAYGDRVITLRDGRVEDEIVSRPARESPPLRSV